MIDIHSHVLPGVDDGASDLLEAQAMLEMACADGTEVLIATPHWDFRHRFDPERCADLVEILRARFKPRLRLVLGCEVHLTPEHLDAVLQRPSLYSLGGSDCILIELPMSVVPAAVRPALDALLCGGLRPVIAHPERCEYIQRHHEFAEELVDMGCYLQLTAQAVMGGFGFAAEQTSRHLLRRRLAHLIASDGHGAVNRRPLLADCFRAIENRFGRPAADLLFVRNPNAVLESRGIGTLPANPLSWIGKVWPSRLGSKPGNPRHPHLLSKPAKRSRLR